MCMEDVRIARQTTLNSYYYSTLDVFAAQVYGPDARRTRLIIAAAVPEFTDGPPIVEIWRGREASGTANLIYYGNLRNPLIFDFEQWGQVVQGPLAVKITQSADTGGGSIAEMFLNEPTRLGDAITSTPRG